ncbi:MAG: ArsA family ATPase, partial [Deltaproteobacteria bacterium]|nr:ArsA family ATPase [Deltaproteobacteria bacterium]
RGVDALLTDPEKTTVRLVTNPEKIVLKETQRAFMYFSLYKMSIDAVIMNRVLPDVLSEPYFQNWQKSQKQYVQEAECYFEPVPLLPVNLFKGEILGFDNLKALGDQIYGARNPLDRFFKGKPYEFSKRGGKYQLKMKLPFIEKRDVALHKIADELIVRIGGFKRSVILPRQVAALDALKATLEGQYLLIDFDS